MNKNLLLIVAASFAVLKTTNTDPNLGLNMPEAIAISWFTDPVHLGFLAKLRRCTNGCNFSKGYERCFSAAAAEAAKLDSGSRTLIHRIEVEKHVVQGHSSVKELIDVRKCVDSSSDESEQKKCLELTDFYKRYKKIAKEFMREEQTVRIILDRIENN